MPGLRYILLVFAMLSDIALILAAGVMFGMLRYLNPSFPMFLGCCIVFVFAILGWRDTGGFENWRPSAIRQYLQNAEKLGL